MPTAKFTADNIAGNKCGKLTTNFDASGTGNTVPGANRNYDWGYDDDGTLDHGTTVNKTFGYSSNTPRGGIGVYAYLVPYKFFSERQVSEDSEKTICKALMSC